MGNMKIPDDMEKMSNMGERKEKKKYPLSIIHIYTTYPEKPAKLPADMTDDELCAYLNQCKQAENKRVYRTNPDLIERRIGDEWVLVPVGEYAQKYNGMITLNVFSHFIWEQFKQPNSLDKVLHEAEDQFDDPEHVMELQIRQFMDKAIISQMLLEIRQDV